MALASNVEILSGVQIETEYATVVQMNRAERNGSRGTLVFVGHGLHVAVKHGHQRPPFDFLRSELRWPVPPNPQYLLSFFAGVAAGILSGGSSPTCTRKSKSSP